MVFEAVSLWTKCTRVRLLCCISLYANTVPISLENNAQIVKYYFYIFQLLIITTMNHIVIATKFTKMSSFNRRRFLRINGMKVLRVGRKRAWGRGASRLEVGGALRLRLEAREAQSWKLKGVIVESVERVSLAE